MRKSLVDVEDMIRLSQDCERAAVEARQDAKALSDALAAQSSACEAAIRSEERQVSGLAQIEACAGDLSAAIHELSALGSSRHSAQAVISACGNLAGAIEEINGASGEILTALSGVDKGAQRLSLAPQRAMDALARIESPAVASLDSSGQALESAEAATERLEAAVFGVYAMINGVFSALESAKNTRERLDDLENLNRKIDKVVNAMSRVAIQNAMLVVNGSIVAARAGKFGTRFEVVSNEFRLLARDSQSNSAQVKDLVNAIRSQIVAVRRHVNEIAESTSAEVEKNKLLSESMLLLLEDMGRVVQGARDIRCAFEQIVARLAEVRASVETVATAVAKSSTESPPARQAAAERSNAGQALASAVEEMIAIADELREPHNRLAASVA